MQVFTVKEYIPGYNGLDSFYVTYNLKDKTMTINGKTKPLTDFWYRKALQYIKTER